jgi:hypothetical protein
MNAIEILVEEQLREPGNILRSANAVSSVPTMTAGLAALATSIGALLRSRASLQLRIPALRHRLAVLQGGEQRPRLKPADRLPWVWLSRGWLGLQNALVFVKPSIDLRGRPGAIRV